MKKTNSATTRSTAGSGFAFEDLVAADLLSRFLHDMPIPGIETPGLEILSQAAAAGWEIDDLVCVGCDANGKLHRLALSCKSNVQVTASGWPKDFIAAAWRLWRASAPFNSSTDHIGLVTRGRNASFDATWSDLKLWCNDPDASLALGRINASQKHRKIFDSVRNAGETDGALPTEIDTIALIARLHLYPLDFQLSPSLSLEEAKQRCRSALNSETQEEADTLWEVLVQSAETARLGSGIVRLPDLLRDLSSRFGLKSHPSIAAAWKSLLNLSADQRAAVETALPNGYVVERHQEVSKLSQILGESRACIVTGESGVGKSALVAGVLDQYFSDATQLWLGPDALHAALSVVGRSAVRLDHSLDFVLDRSPGDQKLLILDSVERIKAPDTPKLAALVSALAADATWRVIVITQLGLKHQLRQAGTLADAPLLPIPTLSDMDVRAALRSVPSLAWISNDQNILPLFANLKTLGWVVTAESSFREKENGAPTSSAEIADCLWRRWTNGPAATQLQRLLIQLAVRDAAFERSFAVSELDSGASAAFDQRSPELPLVVNARNRIEFGHDLASDWARYQRLKEIADDVEQWSALAPQPLWIPALRLLGQYLLAQPDQDRDGWDGAFAHVTAEGNVEASDILLDALCLDAHLDRHLDDRMELLFANDGALLKRLLHRFLHVATVPSIPSDFAIDNGLRIYIEAEIRLPLLGRWWPMGRFLYRYAERIGGLGASIVARVCKTWLSLPRMLGEQPMPLRDVMAKVALETARTEQVMSAARYMHGGGDDDKLIYKTALAGAPDLPDEVAAFALEMAQRRAMAEATQVRVDALRAADRAAYLARIKDSPPRERHPPPPTFISGREELPPWPLGPQARLVNAFRDAVLHGDALVPLMDTAPAVATEVLLACIIEDQPAREYGGSHRMEEDLGLEFDHEGHPIAFWKSPFFPYLTAQPEAALACLKQLLDFVVERWASEAPPNANIPSLAVPISETVTKCFRGTWSHYGWSQKNSTSNGQLYSALDALERWLSLKIDAGEDISPWCDRLLEWESSTAILGVLVNVGKYQPSLFLGPLRPLVGIEDLYWWDHARVKRVEMNFDAFFWCRQGDIIFNLARDWILAPHRQVDLRTVISELASQHPNFARDLQARTSSWAVPEGKKERLEQQILLSELDPANRREVPDEETGELVSRFFCPEDLQAEINAYQTEADVERQPIALSYQCRRILAQTGFLADSACAYLANLLPQENDDPAMGEDDKRVMIAAAAATLIARGGEWLEQHQASAKRAEGIIRHIIGQAVSGDDKRDRIIGDEALFFAALGALSAALAAESPCDWDTTLVQVIATRDRGATGALMTTAYRHKGDLGPAWYRLNFVLLLAAALDRLAPRYEEEDRAAIWQHWLARLQSQPIFGTDATLAIVDPTNIARRAERLLERRRARLHPKRPVRLSGKSRRFAGVSAHILEAGYSWLLDHENDEALAQVAENHRLLADLWAFEAWRMEGERNDDGDGGDNDDEEYDLPSGLGHAILRVAPTFVMAKPVDDLTPLWRAIFAIGPNGYYATEEFASGWFMLLFKQLDTDRFMMIWKAMLDTAFAANWSSGRRWYRGRRMISKLLGLDAHVQLSSAAEICARLPELTDYYRRWTNNDMAHDEDEIATFCHFLTTGAGESLRLEGMCWISDALAKSGRLYRSSTGNNIAEAVDTVLTHNADELLRQQLVRDAVIKITAKLVAAQIPTAMGLQARLATLK